MTATDPLRARASLQEISARQEQATTAGLRTPRWYVAAVALLVLALNVAVEALGRPGLVLVAYLAVLAALAAVAGRYRQVRVHTSWYTPRVRVVAVVTGAAMTAGLGGLMGATGWLLPAGVATGMGQALLVLVLVPPMERAWVAAMREVRR